MPSEVWYVLAIVAVALIFDFINGFHDSANSIATVVSTRVLSPGVAVVWAAVFNFAAAFVVGTAVAKTIGKGLIEPSIVDPNLILSALVGTPWLPEFDGDAASRHREPAPPFLPGSAGSSGRFVPATGV